MRVGAVIAARDEALTLPGILGALAAAGVAAVTVVANGCRDGTARVARAHGAHVLEYPQAVGHDVGRALGAQAMPGPGGLLFLDADLPLAAADLRPFVGALAAGVDVALNRLDPYIRTEALRHPVLTGKRFLNVALGRPDLGHSTLTAVPHGLSRQALDVLRPASLTVPTVAHVRAILRGLRVEAVHAVDVIRLNPRRPWTADLARLITGDHLEALQELLHTRGPRAGYPDLGRCRDLVPPE